MKTITVKGSGTVSATPDYIQIFMTVENTEKSYDEAVDGAGRMVRTIRDAVIRAGFEQTDLKTADFRVETNYEIRKDPEDSYRREFAGYTCSHRLKLCFDLNKEKLARVVSAIHKSGAEPEISLSFTVKNREAVSESLLRSAAENARKKAQILCDASGSRLGDLQSISYNWSELNICSSTCLDMREAAGAYTAKAALENMEPEDIDLRDTAVFVWTLA